MSLLDRFRDRLAALFGRAADRRNGSINFPGLSRALHYRIRNRRIFREALSHRSYLQVTSDDTAVSNERLEFLGDSILNLVVAEYLFHRFTAAPEGDLTKIRSRLVSRKALSVFARELRLADFILLSPSASQVASRGMDTILADAFEAVIGAVYLDGGYANARDFISRSLRNALDQNSLRLEDENFKSRLLEYLQAGGLGVPRYITVNEEGPDHDRTFTVEVFIGSTSCGVGYGKNKKDAEQAAAEQALRHFTSGGS